MNATLSANTKAILLLTAPLITGRVKKQVDLLRPSEYKKLALHLRSVGCQPADLVSAKADDALRECGSQVAESRLKQLLSRGFLLSQAVEHWRSRAIWVVSRADAEYPRRFKTYLREDAPAVVYGCGERRLLESGGLAVVGSRRVDQDLIDFTKEIGQDVARASRTLVSGGARGIDSAAMEGARDAGGTVCGVLPDSLEKQAMNRANRDLLLDKRLVLISHCDPSAGFNVGNAMQRNKYIYALSDAALVVNSDLKGGTWEGAKEQLTRFHFVPIHVRATGAASPGLDALREMGALDWPDPCGRDELRTLLDTTPSVEKAEPQLGLLSTALNASNRQESDARVSGTTERSPSPEPKSIPVLETKAFDDTPRTPADALYSAAAELMREILTTPMKDDEIAITLNISKTQATAWLKRLVIEGSVEKTSRPVKYVVRQ